MHLIAHYGRLAFLSEQLLEIAVKGPHAGNYLSSLGRPFGDYVNYKRLYRWSSYWYNTHR